MIDFIDKSSEQDGTPINRAKLMGVQGFVNSMQTWHFNTVEEVTRDSGTMITTFEGDKITRVFTSEDGSKTITKTTNILSDGSVHEVIS